MRRRKSAAKSANVSAPPYFHLPNVLLSLINISFSLQMMENRVGLESSLEQLKPFAR
jgi:hypothetical protein